MAWSVSQILQNIPEYIKTGIEKNIKSFNHRPLMIEMAKNLVRGRENAYAGRHYAIKAIADPDNPGELMFVISNISGARQIVIHDTLPTGQEFAEDTFVYVRQDKAIYTQKIGGNGLESIGYIKNLKPLNATNGAAVNFPSGNGNEAYYINLTDPNSNIGIWLGGYGGVYVSHNSLVFAKKDSVGGTFGDVGHEFVIINQRSASVIQIYDHFSDFPLTGSAGIIYIADDTRTNYYWSMDDHEYVENGSNIYGTYINETTFEDTDGYPVIPGSANIYIDSISNQAYNWNGSVFVPLNSTYGGGDGIQSIQAGTNITIDNTDPLNPIINASGGDFSDLTNNVIPKKDQSGNALIDSNIQDTAVGSEIAGRMDSYATVEKRTATTASSSFTIDLSNPSGHYDLTLTDNTSISFSNMIVVNQSTVITLVVDGNYSLLFPSWLKPMPNNDDYYSNSVYDVNLITILIRNGGHSPQGMYSLTNVDLS